MGKREQQLVNAPSPPAPDIVVSAPPEVEAVEPQYMPIEVPLGNDVGPDIRNVNIRLTRDQAIAYRRLRDGLVRLNERLNDGRLVDDSIRGQPLQWLLERLADVD